MRIAFKMPNVVVLIGIVIGAIVVWALAPVVEMNRASDSQVRHVDLR